MGKAVSTLADWGDQQEQPKQQQQQQEQQPQHLPQHLQEHLQQQLHQQNLQQRLQLQQQQLQSQQVQRLGERQFQQHGITSQGGSKALDQAPQLSTSTAAGRPEEDNES